MVSCKYEEYNQICSTTFLIKRWAVDRGKKSQIKIAIAYQYGKNHTCACQSDRFDAYRRWLTTIVRTKTASPCPVLPLGAAMNGVEKSRKRRLDR